MPPPLALLDGMLDFWLEDDDGQLNVFRSFVVFVVDGWVFDPSEARFGAAEELLPLEDGGFLFDCLA